MQREIAEQDADLVAGCVVCGSKEHYEQMFQTVKLLGCTQRSEYFCVASKVSLLLAATFLYFSALLYLVFSLFNMLSVLFLLRN